MFFTISVSTCPALTYPCFSLFFTISHFCLFLSSPHLPMFFTDPCFSLFFTISDSCCPALTYPCFSLFFTISVSTCPALTYPCFSLFFTISISSCPALTYPCFSPFPGTCPRLRPATLRRIKGVRILPHTVRSVLGLPVASRITARPLSLEPAHRLSRLYHLWHCQLSWLGEGGWGWIDCLWGSAQTRVVRLLCRQAGANRANVPLVGREQQAETTRPLCQAPSVNAWGLHNHCKPTSTHTHVHTHV